jgi:hypothetical protein
MRGSLFQITMLIILTTTWAGRTVTAVRKGIPHNHVDLPPLVSAEVTGVCIPVVICEVLLAAVYKSPGHGWSDADIIELLSFICKSILAGECYASILQ